MTVSVVDFLEIINVKNCDCVFAFVFSLVSLHDVLEEAAVKKAFEDPEVPAATLCVFVENPGAKKCYEGAGFKETQTIKHAFVFKDEIWGRCHMAVKRGEEL